MNDMPSAENDATPDFARYGVASSDLANVIVAFAQPMLEQCETYGKREEAVSWAILAWNLSLEKPAEQKRLRAEVVAQIPESGREQMDALLEYLLQRKQELYADNRFYILDYTLTPHGEGMRIEMSTRFVPRK